VKRRVRRHVDVERDILDIGTWIARDSREAAVRFFESVEGALTSLRSMPDEAARRRFGTAGWLAFARWGSAAFRTTSSCTTCAVRTCTF
jgi:plasmid stabilization system protein ParE